MTALTHPRVAMASSLAHDANVQPVRRANDVGELFTDHAPFLLRTCERLLAGTVAPDELRAVAEDIVQDVFLLAHRRRRVVLEHEAPRGWLYRAMVNTLMHRRRGFGRFLRALERRRAEPSVSPQTPADHAERVAHALAVRRALGRLPLQHREILVLCEFEGLDHRTVAVLLGVAVGTVGSRLHQARKAFRQEWQPQAEQKGTRP